MYLHVLLDFIEVASAPPLTYIWGVSWTDQLESKHKKLASQIRTILGFTQPYRHIHTNIDIKGLKHYLRDYENHERHDPVPSDAVRQQHHLPVGRGLERYFHVCLARKNCYTAPL
jgi:hypothetical protein